MSMNSLIEIFVHLHSFRNIELCNQGLYQIRTKVYYLEKNLKYFALPYMTLKSKQTEENKSKFSALSASNLIPSHISDNTYEFVTKAFLIRYSEEEIVFDDFCQYRFNLPFTKLSSELTFQIEVELFFTDAMISQQKQNQNNSYLNVSTVELKSVAKQTINVKFENENFSESYVPIVFPDLFYSLVNISVGMALIENSLKDNSSVSEKMSNTNNSTLETSMIKSGNVGNKILLRNYSINLKEGDQTGVVNYDEQKSESMKELVDLNFSKVVSPLVKVYFSLKKRFSDLVNVFCLEDDKKKYSLNVHTEENDKFKNEIVEKPEDLPNFSERISNWNFNYIHKRMLYEANYTGGQIYQLWHKYIEIIRQFPKKYMNHLSSRYKTENKNELQKFFIKNVKSSKDKIFTLETNITENFRKRCLEHREILKKTHERRTIENIDLCIKPENCPIIIEERYEEEKFLETNKNENIEEENTNKESGAALKRAEKPVTEKLHLFILVHGLQGHSLDMRYLKNTIAEIYNKSVVLVSNSNQNDTETVDIETLAQNLSNEVKTFMKEWFGGIGFDRISFVGHSLGGLIIRAALPHLKEFSKKFYSYISLATPHLGYISSKSVLVDAGKLLIISGLWVMQTWKKSVSLEQIALADAKEIKHTYLYDLSHKEGLEYFNNVVFVSSHQDSYAPFESARIQLFGEPKPTDTKLKAISKMANNIVSKAKNLVRFDVNFFIPDKNIESYIGRTAHIQFLENQDYMRILFSELQNILI